MNQMLSVSLTADVNNFTAGLNSASQTSNQTGQAVQAMSTNISRNIAAVNRVNMSSFTSSLRAGTISVNEFRSSVNNLTPTADNLRNTANRAGSAMTDFSRIVQDAPFGFIAIQNNLNPMLESFNRLRAEAGSTGAAFRAMAGQLTGAAGLGIALSLVSSAITAYTMYQQRANKATREAKEASKDYADTLNAVDRGLLKGTQSALSAIIPMERLYAATQNLSLSDKERNKAVDALQKEYPKYFGNLTNEAILTGQAAGKVKELTQALVAKAQAMALEEELKDSAKILRSLEKREELNKKALDESKARDKVGEKINQQDAEGLRLQREKNKEGLKGVNIFQQQANTEAVKITKDSDGNETAEIKTTNTLLSEQVGIQNQKTVELNKQSEIVKTINAIVQKDGVDTIIDAKESTKKVKTLADVLKDLAIDLSQVENKIGATFDDKQKGKISSYQKAIDELIKLGFNASSDAVVALKSNLDNIFNADQKKKAEEFFNFTLPNRLAGETAEKVKKEADTQKKALQEAIKQGESDWQEFRNPTASQKVEKNTFVMGFDKSDIKIEMENIKSAMDLMSKTFDESGGSLDDFKEKYSSLVGELRRGEFVEQLNVLAEGFITSGIQEIAGAVGEAFVNGTSVLAAAGGALLGAFGKFLSEYGDLLIAYGAAAVLKGKLDLAAMIPGAGILAGTAAIAAGFALKVAGAAIASFASGKNSSNSKGNERKPTAFANGGIISGPTYGLMGEYSGAKNNPEVVAPLSKLKGMIADSNSGGEINTRIDIEGEQLFIILERTKRRLERSN